MRTVDEIFESMKERFAADSGTALISGGDMWLRLYAVAAEIFSLEAQAEYVGRQSFPQTATGEYLDRHALLRGLTRRSAEKAQGTLKFSVSIAPQSDIPVPAGTMCMTAAEQAFVTTQDAAISAGELYCEAGAQALIPGAGGNVPAGSIIYMTPAPIGIESVTNSSAFSDGSGEETDDELRQRVIASYRRLPNGANKAYYENRVLGVSGVEAVTVLPRNRGTGTVDVVFSSTNGVPSPELVAQVQSELEAEREICVDIEVSPPETISIGISAEIAVGGGYGFEDVSSRVQAAISAFFSGKILGQSIYRARLGAIIMGVEGVENYTLSAPAQDTAISGGQLAVLDGITLSQAV